MIFVTIFLLSVGLAAFGATWLFSRRISMKARIAIGLGTWLVLSLMFLVWTYWAAHRMPEGAELIRTPEP
jgi:hypothetical protein